MTKCKCNGVTAVIRLASRSSCDKGWCCLSIVTITSDVITFTFTFMHLADAFIQSDLQLHSGYTFLLVHVFPGNRTHNLSLSWRNVLPLSHTGTLVQQCLLLQNATVPSYFFSSLDSESIFLVYFFYRDFFFKSLKSYKTYTKLTSY